MTQLNHHECFQHYGNITEKVRFKEAYLDTIYTLSENKLSPYLIFNTGKYHYPAEERYQQKENDERVKDRLCDGKYHSDHLPVQTEEKCIPVYIIKILK